MDAEMLERMESALANGELRKLIDEMRGQGISQVEIYCIFDEFRDFLDKANREADMDLIMDVMDFIWGWCRPCQAFFPHELTDEEVRIFKSRTGPRVRVHEAL